MQFRVEETVTLQRDVLAIRVPNGDQVVLAEGAQAGIVQALGGSFTVQVHGLLFRIDGDNADALGKEPPPKPALGEDATDAEVEGLVWEQLKTCYDPEIPINIVDLGLVYSCDLDRLENGQRSVFIRMTLTAPGCGMGNVIADDVRYKVEQVPTVERAEVQVIFDPPWTQSMMSDAARLELGMF